MRRLPTLTLVVTLLASALLPGTIRAQEGDEDGVLELMEDMSSMAKVGQLFLVAFPGAEVSDDSSIMELIRDYHIGGVVLMPENGNIVNEGDTPEQVAALVGQLQSAVWNSTYAVTETVDGEPPPGPFIPLFIAVNHEGNGMPFTGIVNGTTPLPSAMALGATWNPVHAETVGRIVGQELRAMGINMLLGPSLDVLETPRPGSTGDPGVRSFGGDPFWVGKMGQSYIRGVHGGSEGHVAVVAKHFPGLGASDRSLDEEVSTVQRTLEKLRQVDLAPFAAVAQASDVLARPDGVMVSHIRFQGLEGGRFVKTRPISVDSQVLQRLLGLPEMVGWRGAGGVTVSDSLGLRALRRFYDPLEESFNSRRIAQEAFLAGNDILFLNEFALEDDWDEQIANVESTITFFRDKYDSDPSFQVLVDAAVARVLELKLSLYGDSFRLGAVRPNVDTVSAQVGFSRETVAAIGRDAVSLLSPPSADLVPQPPTSVENIVIFSDGRSGQPCEVCVSVPVLDPRLVQDTILRLYGPSGTRQIPQERVLSFTFTQLEEYLNLPAVTPTPVAPGEEESTPTPSVHPVGFALQNANWIIFAMLNPAGDPPQSMVVRRFLAERADALRGPHVVVLAYDAPYYLDATEISKLSAYFVAYGRTSPFVEASVRAMFAEFTPPGAPPVSVPGINYDLQTQMAPDPGQTIVLTISEPGGNGQETPEPLQLKVGDELRVRTGVIVDHNGRAVPDGTPVQFTFTYPLEGYERSVVAVTRDGIAEAAVTLERTGQLDIWVQADPVPRTVALQITIQEGEPAIIVAITPTPRPATPEPTATSTAEPESPGTVQTPSPVPTGGGEILSVPDAEDVGLLDLLLALVGVLIVGSVCYYVVRFNRGPVGRAMRLALWSVIGGLALYLAYSLRLPGSAWLREQSGVWASVWVALLGGLIALFIASIVERWGESE